MDTTAETRETNSSPLLPPNIAGSLSLQPNQVEQLNEIANPLIKKVITAATEKLKEYEEDDDQEENSRQSRTRNQLRVNASVTFKRLCQLTKEETIRIETPAQLIDALNQKTHPAPLVNEGDEALIINKGDEILILDDHGPGAKKITVKKAIVTEILTNDQRQQKLRQGEISRQRRNQLVVAPSGSNLMDNPVIESLVAAAAKTAPGAIVLNGQTTLPELLYLIDGEEKLEIEY